MIVAYPPNALRSALRYNAPVTVPEASSVAVVDAWPVLAHAAYWPLADPDGGQSLQTPGCGHVTVDLGHGHGLLPATVVSGRIRSRRS